MISLQNVSVSFDFRPILDDIDFCLDEGRQYALMAPNGSGKTTLLHVMAGLLAPSSGQVLMNHRPMSQADRARIGVVLQQPLLYGDLTGQETLRFYAKLYGYNSPDQHVHAWLKAVGLGHAADQRIRTYSKGMKQRLSLARALFHHPECVLLDEPYDGLDEEFRLVCQHLVHDAQQRGASVFLVTHHESDVHLDAVRLTIQYGNLVLQQ